MLATYGSITNVYSIYFTPTITTAMDPQLVNVIHGWMRQYANNQNAPIRRTFYKQYMCTFDKWTGVGTSPQLAEAHMCMKFIDEVKFNVSEYITNAKTLPQTAVNINARPYLETRALISDLILKLLKSNEWVSYTQIHNQIELDQTIEYKPRTVNSVLFTLINQAKIIKQTERTNKSSPWFRIAPNHNYT